MASVNGIYSLQPLDEMQQRHEVAAYHQPNGTALGVSVRGNPTGVPYEMQREIQQRHEVAVYHQPNGITLGVSVRGNPTGAP